MDRTLDTYIDMMLFTVTAIFSDFTVAIEQYEAVGPESALEVFLNSAESLTGYDVSARKTIFLNREQRLTHLVNMCGVWDWHLTISLEHEGVEVLGGSVIQSDFSGPKL